MPSGHEKGWLLKRREQKVGEGAGGRERVRTPSSLRDAQHGVILSGLETACLHCYLLRQGEIRADLPEGAGGEPAVRAQSSCRTNVTTETEHGLQDGQGEARLTAGQGRELLTEARGLGGQPFR